MNKLTFLTSLIYCLILCISCGNTPEQPKNAENPNDKAAIEAIKQEKMIINALISDDNILYAAMKDDGSSQNGYAEVVCAILGKHKAATRKVRIIELGSHNKANADTPYGVLLGESNCEWLN